MSASAEVLPLGIISVICLIPRENVVNSLLYAEKPGCSRKPRLTAAVVVLGEDAFCPSAPRELGRVSLSETLMFDMSGMMAVRLSYGMTSLVKRCKRFNSF